jgi:hypothetical protein
VLMRTLEPTSEALLTLDEASPLLVTRATP